ncbi:MAG: Fe-S cluster assembly protein SufD [Microthrixaceae bacterium]
MVAPTDTPADPALQGVLGPDADPGRLADAAAALPGPAWLVERRRGAATAVAEVPLPTVDAEEWRYSRIAELDTGRYTPVVPAGPLPAEPPQLAEVLSAVTERAGLVVLVDGVVVRAELSDAASQAGVTFGPVSALDGPGPLDAATGGPVDRFAALNAALAIDPVVLDVPRSVDLAEPFVVVQVLTRPGAAVFGRLAVRAGENSRCSVVEVAVSDDVDALTAPVTELVVGAAARVAHTVLQDVGRQVWQLGSLVAEVGQDATLDVDVAALGGSYARLRLDCRLTGRGATGNLSSIYFGDGHQMLDLRTFQEHVAPDTTSNLLFKGAVADTSHAVYSGLIRIRPHARGTNAFQTNRIVKLSEHAWAESVPNLEIENNDVHCSHASTVGPVDEDQLFYLESRGVPTEVAERLIVGGFFDEVLDTVAVPGVADLARGRIDALLDRRLGRRGPA